MATPLYDLCHVGDVEGVRQWLDKAPEDLNAWIAEGYTPLHVACIFGHEDLTRFLLSRGALVNINAMNPSRATPLHGAVVYREEPKAVRVSKILIENGAELNAPQRGGQTPLHHAVARSSVALVNLLIVEGADPFLKDDQGRSPSDLAKEIVSPEVGEAIRAELKKAFSLV